MIKAIIVDDEKNSRLVIRELLSETFDEIVVVAEAGDVESAVEAIETNEPDLLFLDIDLPDGTGFDVLKKIEPGGFKVIFITAHHEHAIKAIKFSAFDYILKPVNTNEVIEAVNRALKEQDKESNVLRMEAVLANFGNSLPELKKIVLKTSEKIYLVNIKDIVRCESENNYTVFYLSSGKKILVSKTIKIYDEMLTPHGFMRIHQSHLINLNYILHYDKQNGGILTLSDNSTIPVSHTKRQVLLDYFESL
jgi:two-component system LytT family response regulator